MDYHEGGEGHGIDARQVIFAADPDVAGCTGINDLFDVDAGGDPQASLADDEASDDDDADEGGTALAGKVRMMLGVRDEEEFQQLVRGAATIVSLAAGIGAGPDRPTAKRRNRGARSSSDVAHPVTDSEEFPRRHKTKEPAQGEAEAPQKTRKGLAGIRAREGEGPFDWLELARKIMVPISLVDFWQTSPEGARIFRQLSSRTQAPKTKAKPKGKGKAKAKGKGKAAVDASAVVAGIGELDRTIQNTNLLPRTGSLAKTYRLDITIIVEEGKSDCKPRRIGLPRDMVHADQGSEANLITRKFANDHKLPLWRLTEIGFRGLEMVTADGA